MRGNVLRHLRGVEADIVHRFLHIFRQHEFVRCDITSSEADWVAEVRESDVPLTAGDAGVGTGGDIGAVRKGYRERAAGEVGENNKERAENYGEKHFDETWTTAVCDAEDNFQSHRRSRAESLKTRYKRRKY